MKHELKTLQFSWKIPQSKYYFRPSGIAIDSNGNVYVADTSNDRIQKFSSDGTFLTQWGNEGFGDGQFNSPYGIAVDSSGNVYVTDDWNEHIQKFSYSDSDISGHDTETSDGGDGDGGGCFITSVIQ